MFAIQFFQQLTDYYTGFSPDPVLTGVAMIETVQGIQDMGVIACAKHYGMSTRFSRLLLSVFFDTPVVFWGNFRLLNSGLFII